MGITYEVEMVDGSTVSGDRRPVHLLRVERLVLEHGRKIGMHEEALMYVWAAVTGGTGTIEDFESWTDQVADWKRAEVDDDPPVQGSDTSPD